MIKRLLMILVIVLFLANCATTKKPEVLTYGGYEKSIEKKIAVYNQFDITFVENIKGNLITVKKPFFLNKNFTLPTSTKELAISVVIENPKEKPYEIWEEYEVLYKEARYPYFIKRKLEEGNLPKRMFKIPLPIETEAYYLFRVKIKGEKGDTLFSFGDAMYTVGKKRK